MNNYPLGINDLFEMLKYKRPHNSPTEKEFMSKYLDVVPGMQKDAYGNRYVEVGDKPTIMWSSHVDTVHKTHGKQHIVYHKDCLVVEKDERDIDKEPLGADDAAGVWIMLNMIYSGVEGLYIFHRAEEKGGIGSSHIVQHDWKLVDNIDHAIAFDRGGTTDVITYQFGERCCSDEFARYLCNLLDTPHYSLEPDSTGVFTDTANYTDLIPECTNISVGYDHEHTADEFLDLFYLTALMDAVLAADWSDLPVERDPREIDYGNTGGGWNSTTKYMSSVYLAKSDLWNAYYNHGAETLIQMLVNMEVTDEDLDIAIDDIREDYEVYFKQ